MSGMARWRMLPVTGLEQAGWGKPSRSRPSSLLVATMTKAIATRSHRSNYPNPVVFKKGDLLVLGEPDIENEGWRRVRTASGNEGWAPVA